MSHVDPNPEYPDLGATVAKHRTKAKAGLHTLSKDERHAYGLAVETAFKARQRSALMRLPSFKPRCASGTELSDGAEIHAHMRKKIVSEHRAVIARERKQFAKSSDQRDAYEKAMTEKREREGLREAA